jgi:hypothetical protein
MWADNILFFVVGIILVARMGHEGVTNRGGNFHEMLDAVRGGFGRLARRDRARGDGEGEGEREASVA